MTDLQWYLESILKDNWQLEIELPDANAIFGADATVSDDGIFEQYQQVLSTHDLSIGQIDTDSDAYVFVVHPCKDTETVRKHVEQIGYRYL